jgi:hypothetical protein
MAAKPTKNPLNHYTFRFPNVCVIAPMSLGNIGDENPLNIKGNSRFPNVPNVWGRFSRSRDTKRPYVPIPIWSWNCRTIGTAEQRANLEEVEAMDGIRLVRGQMALPGLGPAAADGFRFTWWTAREGAPCWIEYRGAWRAGVIVHRGRATVGVALTDHAGRTRYVRRAYQDLRRRTVRPALRAIGGGRGGARQGSDGRSEAR